MAPNLDPELVANRTAEHNNTVVLAAASCCAQAFTHHFVLAAASCCAQAFTHHVVHRHLLITLRPYGRAQAAAPALSRHLQVAHPECITHWTLD
jgi:hypothetical protein